MRKLAILLMTLMLFVPLYLDAQQTYTVTDTTDAGDANPGDGICDDGSGDCTFRAALEEANSTAATDTIHFNLSSFYSFFIPQSPFPDIGQPVVIDGTSEPNYNDAPVIQLEGQNAGFASGLVVMQAASGTTIKGLAIVGFTADPGTPLQSGFGLEILGDNNVIRGNHIGVEYNGFNAVPNDRSGILINGGMNNEVGGTTQLHRNILSENGQHGIMLVNGASSNVISGNYIGVSEFGGASGNQKDGIHINWGHDNTIGQPVAGGKNRIGYNGNNGIMVKDSSGNNSENNKITRDSIYDNGKLGIDLQGDSITFNDNGDGDAGPNNLMNYPLLSNIEIDGNDVDLTYEISTDPAHATYPIVVNFFKSDGNRQGQAFIGTDTFSVLNYQNNAAKSISLTAPFSLTGFEAFTATATSASGNTSEFGFARPDAPATTDSFRCGPGDVTLTASGASGSGITYYWYADSTASAPLDSGTTFLTPYLTDTTVYWVEIEDEFGIASHRTPATAFIGEVPDVSLDSIPDFCIDDAPYGLTEGNPSGGTYAGPGVIDDTLYPNFAGTGQHTITYTFTHPNGCDSSASQNITIHALPQLTLADPGNYCVDAPPATLSFGSPAGGSYSGNGVINDTFFAAQAGVGAHYITYTYTDSNGCTSVDSAEVDVYALPNVSFDPMDNICENEGPIFLSAGSPNGGTYNGPGVSGNQFYPDSVGPGTYTLSYTYTDFRGCDSTVYQTITVDSVPEVQFDTALSVCAGSDPLELTFGTPAGGTYEGNGVQGNVFYPSQVGATSHTVIYTYTAPNGCTNEDTSTITVTSLPSISLNINYEVCIEDSFVALTGGFPASGIYTGPGVVNDTLYPSQAGTGNFTITYSITDTNGCTVEDQDQLMVNEMPDVSLDVVDEACVSENGIFLTGGTPVGGDYSGPAVFGRNFRPNEAGAGEHVITYTYTDNNGCTSSATDTIVVHPLPQVDAGLDKTICPGGEAVLDASGNGTASWSPTSGLSDPNTLNPVASPNFGRTYQLTITDSNGCSNSDVVEVDVVNNITAEAGPDTFVCSGRSIRLLAQGGSQYTWQPAHGLSDTSVADPLATPDSTTTYTVEVRSGECVDNDTVTVETRMTTPVEFARDQTLCIDALPVALTGGSPAGGNYFGPGVQNDTFLAAQSGTGLFDIGYAYENTAGCRDTAFSQFTVQDELAVKYYVDSTCLNSSDQVLEIGTPPGGFYGGPGVVDDSIFNASLAGLGTHSISYTYNATPACSGTDTIEMTVYPFPNISINGSPEYCQNHAPDTLEVGMPAGGYYEGPGINNNVIYPDSLPAGDHTITYYYENEHSCTNSETFQVTILPRPKTGIVADTFMCASGSIRYIIEEGSSFDWSPGEGLNDSTSIAPTARPSETTTYTVEATNNLGCTTIDTTRIKVHDDPVASTTADTTICQGHCLRLGGEPTVTGGTKPYTYSWTPASALDSNIYEDPRACLNNTINFTVTVTDSIGCVDTDELRVTVLNHPPVQFDMEADSFTVNVEDNTQDVASRRWYFGDGATDTSESASHTYSFTSLFRVCLEVTFPNGCVDSICDIVRIGPTGVQAHPFESIEVYPNPTEGNLILEYEQLPPKTELIIYRVDGGMIRRESLAPGSTQKTIDLKDEPQGIYLVKITNGKKQQVIQVAKL